MMYCSGVLKQRKIDPLASYRKDINLLWSGFFINKIKIIYFNITNEQDFNVLFVTKFFIQRALNSNPVHPDLTADIYMVKMILSL